MSGALRRRVLPMPPEARALSEEVDAEMRRERMRCAVAKMADYMSTYDQQYGYEDYSDKTFIDDVLYGLGISLGPNTYRFADGFERFKNELLLPHLKGENPMSAAEQYIRAQMVDSYMYDDKRLVKAVQDFLSISPRQGAEAMRVMLREFVEDKPQTVPEKLMGEWLNQAVTHMADEDLYDRGE